MKFRSSVFSSASGSVAGTTYSRNKNGAYVRNRTKGVNRNTDAQKRVRALFSGAAAVWRNLTADQRQTFQDNTVNYPYVDKLGETQTYTARQLCAKLNASIAQATGGSIVTCLPPVADVPVTNALVENSAGGGTIEVTELEFVAGSPVIPADWQLQIYATIVFPGVGKAWKKSDFRLIHSVPPSTPVLPLAIQAFYEAVFGTSWRTTTPGQNCIGFQFLMVNTSTGQRNAAGYITTSVITP